MASLSVILEIKFKSAMDFTSKKNIDSNNCQNKFIQNGNISNHKDQRK